MKPKTINLLYWIFTALFAFFMFGSAIPNIMLSEDAVKMMHDGLGYPEYFIPFIGVAKVLGVIGILIPGFPRVKEWAYAGLMFDLIGAVYSIYATKPEPGMAFLLLPIISGALSYIFYHKRQQIKLQNSLS